MNFEKLSDRSRGFLQSAQTYALGQGHQRLLVDHLLKVFLDDKEGLASSLIERAGGDPKAARTAVEATLGKVPRVEGSGEVDERGGAISVRADGAYVYLSIPPGALPRRTLVRMWVTPSSSGGTLVELSPIATQLAASAELRVTCADGCAAWRLEGDAAEPLDTRPLPGAVVVRLAALRGRYHFGPSAPLPR